MYTCPWVKEIELKMFVTTKIPKKIHRSPNKFQTRSSGFPKFQTSFDESKWETPSLKSKRQTNCLIWRSKYLISLMSS